MYRLGHRHVHHYVIFGIVGLMVLAVVVAGIVGVRSYFQPHTILKQSSAVTHTVTANQVATRAVTKSFFTMQLSSNWREVAAPQVTYTIYSWAGTGKNDASRRVDVYVDGAPANLAFNHLLPVQSTGNQLEVKGPVSDNCTTFTDKTSASETTGSALSKWSGVNFLCDVANYERDTVGVGSAEGINRVTLHSPRSGTHRILLVYTDNSATPDYTIFVAIVKSFQLL